MDNVNVKAAKGAEGSKDRFGELPHEILRHVISFLPGVDTLRTCLIDTRWLGLLRSATSLDFSFGYGDGAFPTTERFIQLVKMVIQLRGTHSPLEKCEINMSYSEFGIDTEPLVEYALTCQVKELVVNAFHFEQVECGIPEFDLPSISHHLKILHLTYLMVGAFLDFSGCPVLEDLKMERCCIDASKISSQSLRRLSIARYCSDDRYDDHVRIEIHAPRLISLTLDDFDGPLPIVEHMPLLQTAFIRVNYYHCGVTMHGQRCGRFLCDCHAYHGQGDLLLNNFSSAENLELIGEPQMWLIPIDIVCILRRSPILEMLTLQFGDFYTENFEGATEAQETTEQPIACPHLKVNIECRKVDKRVCKILNTLSTCGILPEQISIKNHGSPFY
ncbi:hypothetical protein BRADI_3g54450v3, partial [Brachypodium distachyon]